MKYYVQRTVVQVIEVDASDPETAERDAADVIDADWFERSIDISIEYLVLDESGKICGS